ncbi:MAG: pilus assembly protein CpaA [Alphaproteobacteria bacterium]|nr:MAG: pilus assembly protein CpaA [Alphaproteobacteria bacterium]
MLELLAIAAFAGLLIYAACSDVARLIIPNWVSIAMLAAFPVFALAAGMPLAELGLHLAFGAGALVVGYFLFAGNIIGGGDAKLFAAATVWTGFVAFIPFLFGTVLAGGILALALLAARQFVAQTETNPPFVNRLLTGQSGIPYGVAIMAGGLMAIPSIPFLSTSLTIP